MLLGQDHLNEQQLGLYCSSGSRLRRVHIMTTYNECINSGTDNWALEFNSDELGYSIVYLITGTCS